VGPTSAGLPEDSDYTRFLPDVRLWGSIEDFLDAPTWRDGVHVVMLTGGLHVDLYVGGGRLTAAPDRALPVVLSGAVTKRAGGPGPFFSGIGLGGSLDSAFLCVSDPTLSVDPTLRLGWYTGRAGEGLQGRLALLLDGISRRTGRELVLAGGSGGGFAAIMLASRLERPASAFVWNPQTDLLDYAPEAVADYLRVVLGLDEAAVAALDRPARAAALEAGGIQHSLVAAGTGGLRRLLYLQNAADGHVVSHLAPFLDEGGYRWEAGRHRDAAGRLVLVSPFAEGHDPPPYPVVVRGCTMLLDPETTPDDVVDALWNDGDLPVGHVASLPRDLRAEVEDLRSRASLAASTAADGTLTARLRLEGHPAAYGGMTSVFSVLDGAGRLLGSYPRRAATLVVPLERRSPATVEARLRDGLGHDLFELTAPVVREPQTIRVLILGSCVTRDTLAFIDPERIAVGEYVARHSLVAAFAPPGDPPFDLSVLSSPFQRRMLEWDAASALPEVVDRVAADTDIVLWDLVDERLGVLDHPEGRTTTDSVELRRAIREGHVADPPPTVPFGSEEHRRRFARALDLWRDLLAGHGLLERTLLIAPPWAERFEDGSSTPPSFGVDAVAANARMRDYVRAAVDALGVPVLGADADVTASKDHHWGPAPFHYADSTYLALAEQIVGAVREVASPWGWDSSPDADVVRVPPLEVRAPSTRPRAEASSPAPRALDVVVHGARGRPVSFLLYQGARLLEDTGYHRVARHRFRAPAPGIYRCRVFVMAADGSREPITTSAVRVG
jgi:hypothetical protein